MAYSKDLSKQEYDNLVIREGDVGQIELVAGQGKVLRGTVVDEAGKVLETGATASFVVADDVEVDESTATVANVYKNGCFVKGSLIVAEGYALAATDIANLRQVGIIVEDAI